MHPHISQSTEWPYYGHKADFPIFAAWSRFPNITSRSCVRLCLDSTWIGQSLAWSPKLSNVAHGLYVDRCHDCELRLIFVGFVPSTHSKQCSQPYFENSDKRWMSRCLKLGHHATPLLNCGDQTRTGAFTVVWLWSFIVQTPVHKRRLDTSKCLKKYVTLFTFYGEGRKHPAAVDALSWDTHQSTIHIASLRRSDKTPRNQSTNQA